MLMASVDKPAGTGASGPASSAFLRLSSTEMGLGKGRRRPPPPRAVKPAEGGEELSSITAKLLAVAQRKTVAVALTLAKDTAVSKSSATLAFTLANVQVRWVGRGQWRVASHAWCKPDRRADSNPRSGCGCAV